MSPELALFACLVLILWLLARDWKRKDRVSFALWIPVLWVFILGSRPISAWFYPGAQLEEVDYLEGSPLDRYFFLLLIAVGVGVLLRRRVNWQKIATNNRWLCIFFLYLGISVLWSDYPFVSFKRWIKDLGNPIMVLVILTEDDPVAAAKAVFLRCGYILLPLSVIFIKYFPELGRYYDRFTWGYYYCGVSTNKNALGITLLVCGFFLFSRLLELRDRESRAWGGADVMTKLALLLVTSWLLLLARCATALVCMIVGVCILVGMKYPGIRGKANRLGAYSIAIVFGLLLLHLTFGMGESFANLVGRDMTLTGRTDIWKLVLSEKVNPLIGVGYYSFWLGGRTEALSEGYSFDLSQAHNGYLETYLNSGLLGLFLLVALLVHANGRIGRKVLAGAEFADVRLALFAIAVAYNVTESAFNRLSLIWFVLLLVILRYPRPFKVRFGSRDESSHE